MDTQANTNNKRVYMMTKGAKFAAVIVAAFFLAFGGRAAFAGEVAFVDVAQVINDSTPGKAGQKIVDDLRAQLNAEFEKYSQTESDQAKVRQRQIELNNAYAQEHARISNLVAERLREVTERWLKSNKKGFTAVVPKGSALAVAADADVSREILRLLNREKVDFTAKN